ncbi:MAG: NAD(P)/FAD-dependent oxidoreductase [Promethearchaeota archaeon]
MNLYDLIIVGGGPGGAMAAKTAAEKGLKTIFFERGRKPGEKNASGCGLGPRLWRDFPETMKQLTNEKCPSLRMGIYTRNYFIDKNDDMVGMIVNKPTESVTYEPAKSWIMKTCYRSEFDPWIASLATDAGAELKNSTLIIDVLKEDGKVIGVVDDKGEKYKARLVIGADGVISTVAQKSGLRDKWQFKQVTIVPQYDFYAPRENIDKIMGDEVLACWWCVNNPSAYQVFFGDGFHIGLGNWLGWWEKNPLYYLNRLVGIKYFQERIIKLLDAKPRELHSHLLPWLDYPYNTHTDGVILIGDAGGFPCPLEAEGVYPAMLTGKIAAEVAAEVIPSGDTSKAALKIFDQRWKASSVGIEFEAGPELVDLWEAMPFNQEAMEWFVPMIMELLGGAFDWSEPHIVRFRQIIAKVKSYMPKAMPFILGQVIPLLSKVFEDDLDKLMDPQQIVAALPKLMQMLPEKKKRRRRR